jgi:dihydrofolate synthase/folylpolyglutamate synthase
VVKQGRWQQLWRVPCIIAIQHTIDTDWSGIESKQKFEQLHIVLGVVNDKDLEILPLFPKNAIYYFSKPNNPRGLDATILAEKQEQTAWQEQYSTQLQRLTKKAIETSRILTSYTLAAVPL